MKKSEIYPPEQLSCSHPAHTSFYWKWLTNLHKPNIYKNYFKNPVISAAFATEVLNTSTQPYILEV